MADENGEVAEGIVAPEVEAVEVVETPEAVEAPEPKSEPEGKQSLGDSVRRAVERARSAATEDKPADGPQRGPDGKFVAKQAEPTPDPDPAPVPAPAPIDAAVEAPHRLPKEVRTAWAQIPAEARAPIERMAQAFGEHYEPIRRFDEQARSQGQTLASVLETYTGIENQLRADPILGLSAICQNMGLDFRQLAAHVTGQPHDVNAETQQLRQEVARLRGVEQQFQSHQQQVQQRATADAQSQVEKFATDHPRFEELSSVIGWALKSGLALNAQGTPDLHLAYEYAERLRPAPQPAPVAQTHVAPAPAKAKISMQGAPGSNPVAKSSGSVSEAVSRALSRAQASL